MNKKKWWKILLLALGLVALITILFFAFNHEIRIKMMVRHNIDTYEAVAADELSGHSVSVGSLAMLGIDVNSYDGRHVDFECASFGLVPSSVHYGFFYSADNIPRTYQGRTVSFFAHEDGLLWKENNGDNTCYVEKIYDHWYYYEMSF